jgi:hypothetical protein
MPVTVTIDNFARAESDAMFAAMLPTLGGLGVFFHNRVLEPLERQPVIRQNRDTLYSAAVVDLRDGATLTIPDAGDRYVSVMIVNQDHYINRVFHEAGAHELTIDEFGTDYVLVAARILFDPNSADDLAEVHRLQDGLLLRTGEQRPFVLPDYDAESHTAIRNALLVLARTMGGLTRCFGRAADVDPVRHLIGSAVGWGGLPDTEASYLNIEPGLPTGRYTMTFGDVPADAFWSISVYNAAGYFEPGPDELTNVNSVFAEKNADGTTTVHLGEWSADTPNRVDLPEGWNLLIRLYRPRLDELATWSVPAVEPA